MTNRSKLFPGSNQHQHYMKNFYNVIEKHDDELKLLGTSFKELGIHSTRKSVASMLASGCTISLPITSLWINSG